MTRREKLHPVLCPLVERVTGGRGSIETRQSRQKDKEEEKTRERKRRRWRKSERKWENM